MATQMSKNQSLWKTALENEAHPFHKEAKAISYKVLNDEEVYVNKSILDFAPFSITHNIRLPFNRNPNKPYPFKPIKFEDGQEKEEELDVEEQVTCIAQGFPNYIPSDSVLIEIEKQKEQVVNSEPEYMDVVTESQTDQQTSQYELTEEQKELITTRLKKHKITNFGKITKSKDKHGKLIIKVGYPLEGKCPISGHDNEHKNTHNTSLTISMQGVSAWCFDDECSAERLKRNMKPNQPFSLKGWFTNKELLSLFEKDVKKRKFDDIGHEEDLGKGEAEVEEEESQERKTKKSKPAENNKQMVKELNKFRMEFETDTDVLGVIDALIDTKPGSSSRELALWFKTALVFVGKEEEEEELVPPFAYDAENNMWFHYKEGSINIGWEELTPAVVNFVFQSEIDVLIAYYKLIVGVIEDETIKERLLFYLGRMRNRVTDSTTVNKIIISSTGLFKVDPNIWDKPDKKLCGNGVLDLERGIRENIWEIIPNQPQYYLLKRIEAKFVSIDEPCPEFRRSFYEAHYEKPDKEDMFNYFGERFGSGFTLEQHGTNQLFDLIVGSRARDGKTVFFTNIRETLGNDFCKKAKAEEFFEAKSTNQQGHNTADAKYKNVGWLMVTEFDFNKVDLRKVKEWTGGEHSDPQRVAHASKEKAGFKYTQQSFFQMQTLDEGAFKNDNGVAGRVKISYWNMQFLAKDSPLWRLDQLELPRDDTKRFQFEADHKVATIYQRESSGILAWMLRGYRDFVKNNNEVTKIPNSIKQATSEFLKGESQSPLERFVNEKIYQGSDEKCYLLQSQIHKWFQQWCDEKPNTRQRIAIREKLYSNNQDFPTKLPEVLRAAFPDIRPGQLPTEKNGRKEFHFLKCQYQTPISTVKILEPTYHVSTNEPDRQPADEPDEYANK